MAILGDRTYFKSARDRGLRSPSLRNNPEDVIPHLKIFQYKASKKNNGMLFNRKKMIFLIFFLISKMVIQLLVKPSGNWYFLVKGRPLV